MAAAGNFYDIPEWDMGCQLRGNLFPKKAIVIGIGKKYFFQKVQLGLFKGANFRVIPGKEEHFVKAKQIEIAMSDIVLYPFQACHGGSQQEALGIRQEDIGKKSASKLRILCK